MKVLARIAFSWKVDDTDYSDPGSVVEALRRAGYTVHHMSHDYGNHGTDFIEAIIDGSANDKIMDAIYYEVESIARRNGGLCHEILTLDQKGYIPFEYPPEGKSFFDLHIS
jgi:hypothetical protein